MQQYVEGPIGLQMIHRPAQQALAMERRRHLPRHMLRLWAGAAQMPANGIAHGPAMPPRGVDTAGRERRDDARGVAGQDHARAGDRAFRPAARHQPGAGGRRPRGGRNADHIAHVPKEAIDIRRPHLCRVMAQCQAHLQARRILCDPADIARCEALADEAMQCIALRQLQASELAFDAVKVFTHQNYAGELGHARKRAIGTDQDKRYVLVLDDKNHAIYRQVKLGANQEGLRVVDSGLAAGERIVVNGLQRIRPGDAVAPTVVPMVAAKAAPVKTAAADLK
ncbi:hypothetical protein G6F31_015655 [Rhizopus arrhizus]|nr:hypothetical protein G6F31_015655 [Rhizopus arrhizus]